MLHVVQGRDTSVWGTIDKGHFVQGMQHPRIFGRGHINPASSECAPPPGSKVWGAHSRAGEELGGPNSNDWRKSLALCLLCGPHPFFRRQRMYIVRTVATKSLKGIVSPD
jgi:hypothetical protein